MSRYRFTVGQRVLVRWAGRNRIGVVDKVRPDGAALIGDDWFAPDGHGITWRHDSIAPATPEDERIWAHDVAVADLRRLLATGTTEQLRAAVAAGLAVVASDLDAGDAL